MWASAPEAALECIQGAQAMSTTWRPRITWAICPALAEGLFLRTVHNIMCDKPMRFQCVVVTTAIPPMGESKVSDLCARMLRARCGAHFRKKAAPAGNDVEQPGWTCSDPPPALKLSPASGIGWVAESPCRPAPECTGRWPAREGTSSCTCHEDGRPDMLGLNDMLRRNASERPQFWAQGSTPKKFKRCPGKRRVLRLH